jgi:hypothetical protein
MRMAMAAPTTMRKKSKKKKRGPTKLRRPPNGQQIPIRPLGEE